MPYVLTGLLALAFGWCWGHATARTVHVPIGGTAEQDDEALLADERRRFDELIATLDTPDDPRSSAA